MAAGEERLRDVLDHSHDLIYAASANGRLNYVNRTWQTALGYPRQQADTMTAEDVVAPEFLDAFREAVALALSNARPEWGARGHHLRRQ